MGGSGNPEPEGYKIIRTECTTGLMNVGVVAVR